jgi:hypothetical protein
MHVGLRPSSFQFAYNATDLLKRDLLYFEQVHICSLSEYNVFDEMETTDPEYFDKIQNDLRLAYDHHLVHPFNLSDILNFIMKEFGNDFDPRLQPIFQKILEIRKPNVELFNKKTTSRKKMEEIINEYTNSVDDSENDVTRVSSILLNKLTNDQLVPLIQNDFSIGASQNSKVLEVVLSKIPIPDANVSWQQIIDYRADPDSIKKFNALRVWIQDISRTDYSKNEISDRIDYLLNDYESHLNFHKLKHTHSTLRVWVTTVAEIAESLLTLKFSKIAETVFTLSEKNLELYEAELQAPGREIAYISKVRGFVK